ncbi:hypothetical protein ARMSODRAFT_983477 [Armillaria solidipes]|uniref:Uncharacterized protein n=1 Tax=Armillaria solidipes TaxID=1076256 RepID=A0A2H3AME5_9AGAR|nr:hypothetical protein ARMSODRAFT_983477 [Armillaria solidipes]
MYQIFIVVFIFLFITCTIGAQTSSDNGDDVPVCIEDKRTLLNIIWSCLTTIFACTWLAVHPNVPSRNITAKGRMAGAIVRMKIWAFTILAPEAIVGWSIEQFIAAWKLRHGKYKSITSVIDPLTEQKGESKLTLAHCFLLSMGGFYYTRTYEIPHQVLDTYPFTSTPLSSLPLGALGAARIPTVTEPRDTVPPPSSVHESWSDYTTSINPQFLPDHAPGSRTSHLPGALVTLESLKSEPNLVKNLAAISPETIDDKSKGDALSKNAFYRSIILHLPVTLLEMTALAFAGLSIIAYMYWWHKPLNVKYQTSLDGSDWRPTPGRNDPEESPFPVIRSLRTFKLWGTNSMNPDTSDNDISFDDKSEQLLVFIINNALPYFSGTGEEYPKRFMALVVVGSVFGAFHCAAWSFQFPSHAEMVLWRVSSIAVLIGLMHIVPTYYIRMLQRRKNQVIDQVRGRKMGTILEEDIMAL